MTSQAVRDPLADHLITPQNAAFVLIDYQPSQFATVRSMDPDLLLKNIVSTVKTPRAFGLPIVHSTVNVASGQQQPTVPELAELLEDSPPLDRTTVNSWEDTEFVQAVHATGRRSPMPSPTSTGTTASAFSDPVLHLLRSVTGLGNVMFGTDYPYTRDAISIAGLHQVQDTAELADDERRGILGGSAARLIPAWRERKARPENGAGSRVTALALHPK